MADICNENQRTLNMVWNYGKETSLKSQKEPNLLPMFPASFTKLCL